MHPYITAVQARLSGLLDRLHVRWPLFGLAILAVLYVVNRLLEGWIDTTALPYVWRAAKQVFVLPVGVFGFLFFVLLFSILIAAFIDTSPIASALKNSLTRPGKKQEPPPTRNAEEIEQFQDLRRIWNRYGQQAASLLYDYFYDIKVEVRSKFWSELLGPKLDTLKEALDAMTAAVADESPLSVGQVRERFNRALKAYFDACRWAAEITEQDAFIFLQPAHQERLWAWQAAERNFFDKLEDLNEKPPHRGMLHYHLHPVASPALLKFVNTARNTP
jgi:hypothetical protein